MGASDEIYASGNVPLRSDTIRVLLVKDVNATRAGGGGGGGNNNKEGIGSPVGVVTPDYVGQFYSDQTDVNSVKLWISTGAGNTAWNQLIA